MNGEKQIISMSEVGFKYTPLTIKALQICFEAHKDQVDKAGIPYVFHPFHLAEQMTTEDEICTALLHDVAEDTAITLEELSQYFPETVMAALRALTHDERVPYMDYVKAIKNNPIARKVKLADLTHNSDLDRMALQTVRDRERWQKYQDARALLIDESE